MYSLEISDYLRLSVIYLWNYKIKKKIDFAGQIVRPFKKLSDMTEAPTSRSDSKNPLYMKKQKLAKICLH